jgi:hypothetical protein
MAGMDGCRKISLPPGFDPRTVQPVASRYTGSDFYWVGHVSYKLKYEIGGLTGVVLKTAIFIKNVLV